ncbi:MAG: hypothetical protein H6834_09660 [Planctomycetes bacterium]|nr:hypothetical protein [Planctomycetota bacterium]
MTETHEDAGTSFPQSTEVVSVPDRPGPAAQPFTKRELLGVWRNPLQAIDLLLANRDRLEASLGHGQHVGLLAVTLLFASALFALPLGFVLSTVEPWRVGVLYLGSLVICLPSLQVFGAYLGIRVTTLHNLASGLVISAVAGMFAFGFFPILWFLRATMAEESDLVNPADLGVAMLAFALFAGLLHALRCFVRGARSNAWASLSILLVWEGLVVFIHYRMASVLGLV